jgi:hypothetical protein
MLKKVASLASLMLILVAAGATADVRAFKAADDFRAAPFNDDAFTTGVEEDAMLTAIHAIPGLPAPVDVYVNGSYLLSFDFNESAGPLPLPRGDYDIEIKLQGTTVLSRTVSPMPGKNYTIMAHLTFVDGESNGIALSLFQNNVEPLRNGRTRITVRHTADAPAVDLDLQRIYTSESGIAARQLFVGTQGLANDDGKKPLSFGSIDLWGGQLIAVLYPAGSGQPAFDSGAVTFEPNMNYIVYAIGSLFDGSFTLFVQAIDMQ